MKDQSPLSQPLSFFFNVFNLPMKVANNYFILAKFYSWTGLFFCLFLLLNIKEDGRSTTVLKTTVTFKRAANIEFCYCCEIALWRWSGFNFFLLSFIAVALMQKLHHFPICCTHAEKLISFWGYERQNSFSIRDS